MKNWQIMGFFAVLIIGIVVMCGCITKPGSLTTTPTPQIVYNPVTTTPTPTPALKTILFSDDLSQWRSGWDSEYDGSSGKTFYSGGSLHISDPSPPTGTLYHTLNKNFNDFILDVDTKAIAGTVDNWQGVTIHRQDNQNNYVIAISADGYYEIVRSQNGNIEALTGPTRSSYINTGIGATNHIHVEANKNTLSLSVNGHHLSTVTDNTFKDGTVDLVVNCKQSNSFSEVVFNNLVITTI